MNSCTFDPVDGHLNELGGSYYAQYNKHSPNDGVQILYTEDKEFFKNIASNCLNIYRDSNVIVFSKNLFEGDTNNIEYYTLGINSNTELKKISKSRFESIINKLKVIEIEK